MNHVREYHTTDIEVRNEHSDYKSRKMGGGWRIIRNKKSVNKNSI